MIAQARSLSTPTGLEGSSAWPSFGSNFSQPPGTGEDYFKMEAFFDLHSGKIVGASSNVKSILSYELDFIVGRSSAELLMLLPQEDQPAVANILKETNKFLHNLSHGSILSARISFKVRFKANNEPTKWLRIWARPLTNDYGMVHSYKLELFDISDEISNTPHLQASVAYLDTFGAKAYHRFGQNSRLQNDLNPRELRVVRLLAEGKTSKEIGNLLALSKDTVDKSRKQMLLKTGAKNTVELISKFMQL